MVGSVKSRGEQQIAVQSVGKQCDVTTSMLLDNYLVLYTGGESNFTKYYIIYIKGNIKST